MIDILIDTALKNDRFDNLFHSIIHTSQLSAFNNYNFLVCYTNQDEEGMKHIEEKLTGFNHKVIQRDYHFSKNMNELASLGTGEYLLFLNDDIELIDEDTIEFMQKILETDPTFGQVGIKLLYPDNTIQHFGQAVKIDADGDFVGITHYGWHMPEQKTPNIFAQGVTAAFCMMRREDFNLVGGFNENYRRAFQDVELSWKLRLNLKKIICVGEFKARHFESQTRGQFDFDANDSILMRNFWNENKPLLIDNLYSRTILEK